MNVKICIAGKIASGKSTVAKAIAHHTGFRKISFGDILREYSKEHNLLQTRQALQKLAQDIWDQYGYEGFLQWAIHHSSNNDWSKSFVIDGFRHLGTYERAVKIFPVTILVYCSCDAQTQMIRILSRDKITREEALKIISHPTEIYVHDIEPHAHIVYLPESNITDVLKKLDELIVELTKEENKN